MQEAGIPYLPSEKSVCMSRNNSQNQTQNNRLVPTGKRVHQGCILSPCLFNIYAVYSILNAGLDEAQSGIKIAERNMNNLKYADDATQMAESKELKSLLMRVKKESEKADLKLNIQKTKIMASSLITSWQIDGESGNSERYYFLGLQTHCRW